MDMRKLLEKMDQFAGGPDQKTGPAGQLRGGEPMPKKGSKVHPAHHKLVGGASESKNILHDLEKELKEGLIKRNLAEDYEDFKAGAAISTDSHSPSPIGSGTHDDLPEPENNPRDTIKLDVPLFIRLLEYAREDAKDDMDLHHIAEKLVSLSSQGRSLSMDDYEQVVEPSMQEDVIPPVQPGGAVATASTPAQPATPEELAKLAQDKAKITAGTTALKAVPGVKVDPKMTTALQKTAAGQPMTPADTSAIATAIGPAVADAVQKNPQGLVSALKKAGMTP